MALVSQGFVASIDILDAAGNKSTLRPDVVGADHATALANVQALITELDPLTDGLVAGYRVTEKYAEDTATYGTAGSEVENIAEIVCPLETPGKYATFRIPAPADGIFVGTTGPDRNKVDTADADLLAYVSLFTDKTGYGTPGADAIALVSDGEKVRPDNTNDRPFIDSGKRIHRASRRG